MSHPIREIFTQTEIELMFDALVLYEKHCKSRAKGRRQSYEYSNDLHNADERWGWKVGAMEKIISKFNEETT